MALERLLLFNNNSLLIRECNVLSYREVGIGLQRKEGVDSLNKVLSSKKIESFSHRGLKVARSSGRKDMQYVEVLDCRQVVNM